MNISCIVQAELKCNRMRRVLRVMTAPIFRSRSLMVPQYALLSLEPFKASRFSDLSNEYAKPLSRIRNWLTRK